VKRHRKDDNLVGRAGAGKELGFRVLSTRAASAESVLAFSSLDPLLDSLDESAFAELPAPQRLAIDRVLLRVSDEGPITDQRAVAAAGATNREMAAAMFISPKTVDTNLPRIYRKLDIHSRAELGRIMGSAYG
jgi:hypothetical protein